MVNQGVILAAGKGSRAFPLSLHLPKALFPILNKPIIEYQINAMSNSGIGEIIVVIGQNGNKIKKLLGDGKKLGVSIKYLMDEKPEGIAGSLYKVRKLITGPFILFLGDIFISKIDLNRAIKKFVQNQAEAVIMARKEQDIEALKRNFAVVVKSNGQIIKVIEKPQNPKSKLKGIGVYIFTPAIFDAILKTPKSPLRGEYELTDAIQTLIDMGGKLYCDIWDAWDFNLTYPKDLRSCNLKALQELKKNKKERMLTDH